MNAQIRNTKPPRIPSNHRNQTASVCVSVGPVMCAHCGLCTDGRGFFINEATASLIYKYTSIYP